MNYIYKVATFCALLFHIGTLQAQQIPSAGLQLLYTFNQLNGPTVADRSPSLNDLTIANGLLVPGRLPADSSALFCNGFTTLGQAAFPIALTTNFTFSLWLYPLDLPTGQNLFAVFGIESGDLFLNLGFSGDSGLGFQFKSGGIRQPFVNYRPAAPLLNTWSHIAITRQGTLLKLYVNTQLIDSSQVAPRFIDGSSNAFSIGGSPLIQQFGLSGFYNGYMDNLAIYNRGLTRAGVDSLYTDLTPIRANLSGLNPKPTVVLFQSDYPTWIAANPGRFVNLQGITVSTEPLALGLYLHFSDRNKNGGSPTRVIIHN
jgi:hypothetical protein